MNQRTPDFSGVLFSFFEKIILIDVKYKKNIIMFYFFEQAPVMQQNGPQQNNQKMLNPVVSGNIPQHERAPNVAASIINPIQMQQKKIDDENRQLNTPLDKLEDLYNRSFSNSTRSLLYTVITSYKRVEHLMSPQQMKQFTAIIDRLYADKIKLNNDIYASNTIGKLNRFLHRVKMTYYSQGQNDIGQFRSSAIRKIMMKLNRSSREADDMEDRKYIYLVGNRIQQNAFKFTDTELKRIQDLIFSEPSNILPLSIVNMVNKICMVAAKREDIDAEPNHLMKQRALISKRHSRLIRNNPLPFNY